jgi:hypothetical protein
MLPLDDVHPRLRRGDFGNDLLAIVEDNLSTWVRDRDEGRRLKGLYVAAEVFDYFGEYIRAEIVLQDEGPRAVDDLKKIDAEEDPEIVKRRIWLAVAHAVTLYRKEDYVRSPHRGAAGANRIRPTVRIRPVQRSIQEGAA